MKADRIEEIILLLNEARNKITKANIIYGKEDLDNIYIENMLDLIADEISDLIKMSKEIK